jgi:nucleoside-diphosphate-sugar epimerase
LNNKINTLIIGASSKLSYDYIKKYGANKSNFFGVSSKVDLFFSDLDITIYGYSNLYKLVGIHFNEVLILSSRLPSENISLVSYIETNKKIMHVLREVLAFQNLNTKITLISTFSVYSQYETFLDESSSVNLDSDYAFSKLELEKSLIAFANNNKFSLMILRVPTLLYKGVKTNFIGKLNTSIINNTSVKLFNPSSSVSLIFDVTHIIRIIKSNWKGINLINCSAEPDITFLDIGDLAKKYGLKKIEWHNDTKPSLKVDSLKLFNILGELPSAKKIVKNWFKEEFIK